MHLGLAILGGSQSPSSSSSQSSGLAASAAAGRTRCKQGVLASSCPREFWMRVLGGNAAPLRITAAAAAAALHTGYKPPLAPHASRASKLPTLCWPPTGVIDLSGLLVQPALGLLGVLIGDLPANRRENNKGGPLESAGLVAPAAAQYEPPCQQSSGTRDATCCRTQQHPPPGIPGGILIPVVGLLGIGVGDAAGGWRVQAR